MESLVLGLKAQMKGIPTNYRYKYTTVFMGHYSRYSHVELMENITGKETTGAKRFLKVTWQGWVSQFSTTMQTKADFPSMTSQGISKKKKKESLLMK